MQRLRALIYPLLFLCLQTPVSAQRNHLRFDALSLEQGLSQSVIMCILQDSYGFMWFGTQDGLNRYDGFKFQVYRNDPEKPKSLTDNYITALAEDRAGNLWVGTNNGGLHRFDRASHQFDSFAHDPKNPDTHARNRIQALLVDRDGALWIGTYRSGLDRWDEDRHGFEHLDHEADEESILVNRDVRALFQDSMGVIWVGTGKGPRTLKGNNTGGEFAGAFPIGYGVSSFCEDQRRRLWIGSSGAGLVRYNLVSGETETFKHHPSDPGSLSNDQVNAVIEDPEGELWVATSQGLNKWDESRANFTRYMHNPTTPNSLSHNNIGTLFNDRSGVLWIGTRGRGLNKLSTVAGSFVHYLHDPSNPKSLSNHMVFGAVEDAAGNLWVATQQGLNRLDRQTETFRHYFHNTAEPGSISHNTINALYRDHDNHLWVGTDGAGLDRYDADSDTFRNFRYDPGSSISDRVDRVTAVKEDREGNFWVATFGGLFHFTPELGEMTPRPGLIDGQDAEVITVLHADRKTGLWLGTSGRGLHYMKDERARPIRLANDSKAVTGTINAIYQAPDGEVWVGTDGGLVRVVNFEGRKTYRERDGLANDLINGVLGDERGFIWMSTNHGISRLDPGNDEVVNYDVSNGLQSNEFNQAAYYRGRNGEMFFGGINGFNLFFPSEVRENRHIPPICLTSFRKQNKEVTSSTPLEELSSVSLAPDETVVSFEFVALDYNFPAKNHYAWKLEGFDKQWTVSVGKHDITYMNLAPGNYSLRVKGSNNNGVWNQDGLTIDVHVAPPFWRTWPAYLLYLVAGMGLAHLYAMRLDHRQKAELDKTRAALVQQNRVADELKKVDRMKDEFLAGTSHELQTPLNGIIGIVGSLIDGVTGRLPSETVDNLNMVNATAKRLSNLVNDLLDFSMLKNQTLELKLIPVDMKSLTDVVISMCRPLLGHKPVQLHNDIPADLPLVTGDDGRLQQIMLNLIGNSVKFTSAGEIRVTAEHDGETMIIHVTDTGLGIRPDRLDKIFDSLEHGEALARDEHSGTGLGLAISRKLVQLHKGEIFATSAPGKGSRFSFTLPLEEPGETPPTNPGKNIITDAPALKQAEQATQETPDNTPHIPDPGAETLDEMETADLGQDPSAYRILVVDDEPVNLQVVCNFLSFYDYDVKQSTDGMDALKKIHEDGPFDLVLLDVMMPKLSGFEVCERIRKSFNRQELPVILLTARGQREDLVAGFNCGANDYLLKPFSRDQLVMRIKNHFKMRRIRDRLEKARQAEVLATEEAKFTDSLLHNLGNIITSVLISCELLEMKLEQNQISFLRTANEHLRDHYPDLATFLFHDPRGKRLCQAFEHSENSVSAEIGAVLKEIHEVSRRIEMMKDVIRVQQDTAGLRAGGKRTLVLQEMVERALSVLEGFIEQHQVEVRKEFSSTLLVQGQESHTIQVLINMIKNGIEAMDDLPPEKRRIEMESGTREDDTAYLSIRDFGVGIDPDDLDQIFKHGFTTKETGHGFGLPYCHKVMESMGGAIEVESEGRGMGCQFHLIFPIQPDRRKRNAGMGTRRSGDTLPGQNTVIDA